MISVYLLLDLSCDIRLGPLSSCEPIAFPHLTSHLNGLWRVVAKPRLARLPVFGSLTRPLAHPSVKLGRWRRCWAILARVPVVDVVDVGIVAPSDRTIEVVALLELLPLLCAEQGFHFIVTIVPATGVDFAIAVYAVKVSEVKAQNVVALKFVET